MIPEFLPCSTPMARRIRLSFSRCQSRLFLSDQPRCVPVIRNSTRSCSVILIKTRSSIRPSAVSGAIEVPASYQGGVGFQVITIEQLQDGDCLITHHG